LVEVSRAFIKGRRREHFGIIAEILACAIDGALKTQLMYKANLSYAQLKNYLILLVKLNLLKTTVHGKAIVYETTQKGKSFLERYKELIRLLGSYENPEFFMRVIT